MCWLFSHSVSWLCEGKWYCTGYYGLNFIGSSADSLWPCLFKWPGQILERLLKWLVIWCCRSLWRRQRKIWLYQAQIGCRFCRFYNPPGSYGNGCAKCQSNVTYEDEENFSTTGSSRVAEDYGETGFGGVTEDFDNTENGDVSLRGAWWDEFDWEVKKTHDGRKELLLCAYMKKKLV